MRVVDRGYAAIVPADKGTATVIVAAGLEKGVLRGIFARHVGVSDVHVDSGVAMRRGEQGEYSTQIVDVYTDDAGTLHVRATREGARAGHADG